MSIATGPKQKGETGSGQAGRNELGSDHADRGQPGNLYQDRLREPPGGRMPQHVVDLSRLQHFHEGQGSARRPLHHQPHLRHLRRQPRHLRHATRRTWPSASGRRPLPNGSSTWVKRPNTCSTTTSSRTTWSASTSASRWSARPIPACWPRPKKPTAPNAEHHGYRTIADIMRALEPVHRRVLPRNAARQPLHARDVLPDGRPARASFDALSGRRRHGSHRAAVHRLHRPADAVRRVHEEVPAAARRPVQFLVRGAARLRGSRPPPRFCSAAGARSTIPTSATTPTRT